MPGVNGVGRLELKQSAAMHEHVEGIRLREAAVSDGHRRFQNDPGKPGREFAFVDQFIEETAKLVMNGKNVPHDLAGEVFEVVLRDAGGRDGMMNGHESQAKDEW